MEHAPQVNICLHLRASSCAGPEVSRDEFCHATGTRATVAVVSAPSQQKVAPACQSPRYDFHGNSHYRPKKCRTRLSGVKSAQSTAHCAPTQAQRRNQDTMVSWTYPALGNVVEDTRLVALLRCSTSYDARELLLSAQPKFQKDTAQIDRWVNACISGLRAALCPIKRW